MKTVDDPPPITVVVADDEPLARRKILDFLADAEAVTIVGEAASGVAAVALVNRLRPNVLFLDVRMPGLDGFQVIDRLTHDPTLVFTTAHDEYAVAAFEVRALDYLLKPFGRERFFEALARVRNTMNDPSSTSSRARAREALGPAQPLKQIFIRSTRRILPVNVGDITRFEACDDYVTVHTGGTEHLAAVRMDELETMLDPVRFLRIHRSHIVNLSSVDTIVSEASGRLLVTMKDGTRLMASRSRSRALRQRSV